MLVECSALSLDDDAHTGGWLKAAFDGWEFESYDGQYSR
jgi:hypothetical protein